MYTNLYVKTEYSYMDSIISLDKYFEFAKEHNLKRLSICDTNMSGVYKFVEECQKNDILPIVGLEVKVSSMLTHSTTFLLFCKSDVGYKNLLKISSFIESNDKKTIDFDTLLNYSSDLRVVSVDNSELLYNLTKSKQMLNKYQQAFDFYIGISPNSKDYQYLLNLSIENEAKAIFLQRTKYFNKRDRVYYNCLQAVKDKVFIEDIQNFEDESFETFSLLSSSEEHDYILRYIDDFSRVNLTFDKSHKMPFYPSAYDNYDYLKQLAISGLGKRLNTDLTKLDTYIDRLEYELKVIKEMNFVDYFLIVYDYILFAKKELKMFVGPGRGSAAGSLVSYCIGITDIDPIKYGLMFERFLNVERKKMPDIDVDFQDDLREKVIKYVRDKYGVDKVAYISTFNRYQTKSTLRDVSKTLKIKTDNLDYLLSLVDNVENINEAVQIEKISLAIQNDQKIEDLFRFSREISGLIKNVSTHAAGIVITPTNLSDYVPLIKGQNNLFQTQFEAKDLESLGLLKMDFLGLKNLSIIREVIEKINEVSNEKLYLSKIPLNDSKTFDLLQNGDTLGVFQFESEGMKDILRKITINDFNMIPLASALNRPGANSHITEFVKNQQNFENYKYPHPDLEDILKETYGVILYQEQIIKILSKFANYSYSEADIVRSALSKGEEVVLKEQKNTFITRGVNNGYSDSIFLGYLFDYLLKFAGYGFNKSHAVSYGLLSYYTAYLKANYPVIFLNISMNYNMTSTNTDTYKSECNKFGIKILTPDINKSIFENQFTTNKILLSLNAIKDISLKNVEDIIKEREKGAFTDFSNFVGRTQNFLNDKAYQALIFSSSLDSFKVSKKYMFDSLRKTRQHTSFMDVLNIDKLDKIHIDEEYDYSYLESAEKEALGFNINYNFMNKYDKIKNSLMVSNLSEVVDSRNYDVLARINKIKTHQTKQDKTMAFLELDDGNYQTSTVLFPNYYEVFASQIEVGKCYLFKLSKNTDKNSIQITKIAGIRE